jgi:hypothetical protein
MMPLYCPNKTCNDFIFVQTDCIVKIRYISSIGYAERSEAHHLRSMRLLTSAAPDS